ncbi:MAG: electron transport complex subunit E [Pseudomonadota bacterium]
MNYTQEFTKGIIAENPVLRLLLGLCPVLAVTTSAINGIGMGLCTLFVLLSSNIVVSLMKNLIPGKVRIPCFIVIIASFVTIVDLFMKGFFFDLHKTLGLFIPLIVVNCLILGRAEAFASKNNTFSSILDALGMGLGFTLSLMSLGLVREVLGNGTAFGFAIMGKSFMPVLIMIMPPGAFITLGIMLALLNKIERKV